MSLRKNDIIDIDITGFSSEGSGVGHYEGQAVFVAGAAPGDSLQCIIIKAKKNYAIGKIQHILKASSDRIIPDCPAFPRCGGCQYRHISYDAELKIKTQKVRDAFQRIGHLDIIPEEAVGADSPDRYRNKAQYPVETANGRLLTGFYAPFSHRVIDCKSCLLQPAEFSDILKVVAKWSEKYKIPSYDERTGKGLLRHIYIRKGFSTGEIMVCLVINGDKIFKKDELISALTKANSNIKTVLVNKNTEDTNVIMGKEEKVLYGKGYIEDILCGKRFRISPLSFYQVNHAQAESLYKKAAEFAITDTTKTLVDLYCGAGTIGLTMADKVEKLIGVEIVPEAIEDAKINARLNNTENARFICADAKEAAKILKDEGIRPDTVILDPPRKGCDSELLLTVTEMAPERIVYVSCDPATLARDLMVLEEHGYKTKKAVPFDLFPRTVHVECVTYLTKEGQM
ncbi:MAG: 23S rRNA (uracil(1939)-C(5))-methyltransferase RlmD [Clostridia bacterium]|nr:23S rRNA (uracil(1939)-C(5))-methyltransferase RlmD [Clostridia bacterium]